MQETGQQDSRWCQGQGVGAVPMAGCAAGEGGVGCRALATTLGQGGLSGFSRLRHYPFTAAPRPIQPGLSDCLPVNGERKMGC